ncbi:DUF6708 domain-containing protein [Herbaspirillum huttiense]|uniref:DUF6708 domain-containing protein n=1 Tax=Herbaspirillum huttiense TaxID=863372 RepID=UPI002176AF79|nr:DUF6708 domain-containing protein [Herbaspirillum huttiense]UWE14915.1 hypothetical protein NY669_17635 [Herbaspirillum huttiense]
MNTRKQSRFHPQHPLWYEDLAPRSSPIDEDQDFDGTCFNEDVTVVDENHLEISRESSFMRGSGIAMALIIFLLYGWIIATDLRDPRFAVFKPNFLGFFMACVTIGGAIAVLKLLYLDLRLPRDTPIRFNRKTQKIYVYEFVKPKYWFQLWRTEIKVHDWNCIEAELIKIAGYTGKTYVVRHELLLVVCRPGTNEVVDRISLKGLEPLDAILAEMWTGVRRFMEAGPDAVPGIETKVREIGFLYSLFAYMPYLSPSEAGIRFRNSMRWYDWGLACISIWFFWLWFPLGICHHFAISCAPEPQWPTGIDAESRSL